MNTRNFKSAEILKSLLKSYYSVEVELISKELRDGLGGYMKRISKEYYQIVSNEIQTTSE